MIAVLILPLFYITKQNNLEHQRRNQKRNMAEMRAIGTAIEAYAVAQ